ncbi:MAG: MBL fold metallo-hydrolase [Endomicrobia bacterium]|nr:MBL fold metallo-hydrolase [Endomicrobiia bacterium]
MKKLITTIISLIFAAGFVFANTTVTPYGAAGIVSGSCFLLEAGGKRIIIDCGLFMNGGETEDGSDEKNLDVPDELINADALVLTHAHLDHSGRVPLLISKGFKGKIYCTPATKEIATALYRDRNGLDLVKRKFYWSQTQRLKADRHSSPVIAHWTDGCRANIKAAEYADEELTLPELSKSRNIDFLLCRNCCDEESQKLAERFETVQYGENAVLADNISFKFINSAHIPGSASVIFSLAGKKLLFSGDIGSGYSRLSGSFEVPEKADAIFMESTYADDKSKQSMDDYGAFRADLLKAISEDKLVWIPALSLNRTQKVMYELALMQDEKSLSKDIAIFSVSPSANDLCSVYQKEAAKRSGSWFAKEVYDRGSVIPQNAKLQMIRNFDKKTILFSASGDMNKGKSQQLIEELASRKDVFIMIVNYVSPGSNAGKFLAGKTLAGGFKCRAEIKKYDIFSDHPDFEMLQNWLSNQDKLTPVYLIHSDEMTSAKMSKMLAKKGWKNVSAAKAMDKIVLFDAQ